MIRRILFILTIMLSFLSLSLATGAEVASAVQQLLKPFVGPEQPIVGCSVLIVYGDEIHKFGFGQYGKNDSRVPGNQTIYEIASISKVFTGVLLADMVTQKEVCLTDPLGGILPPEIQLPQKSERKMTLEDVATHRSGLPRLPPDFWATANQTPNNPYELFCREIILESLARWVPRFEPQERYEYSNYAYALLGNVLADQQEMSYESLLKKRILDPLAMSDTRVQLNESQQERLIPGHDANGQKSSNWNMTGFAPSGGWHSTIDDMLRFTLAALGRFDLLENPAVKHSEWKRLEAAFQLSFVLRADGGENHKVGLGWHYNSASEFYHHTGQTGGYFSVILIDRKNKIGIVILSNSFNSLPDEIAVRIRYRIIEGRVGNLHLDSGFRRNDD